MGDLHALGAHQLDRGREHERAGDAGSCKRAMTGLRVSGAHATSATLTPSEGSRRAFRRRESPRHRRSACRRHRGRPSSTRRAGRRRRSPGRRSQRLEHLGGADAHDRVGPRARGSPGAPRRAPASRSLRPACRPAHEGEIAANRLLFHGEISRQPPRRDALCALGAVQLAEVAVVERQSVHRRVGDARVF